MGLSILATYLVSHCQAKCIVVKPRGKVCACALVYLNELDTVLSVSMSVYMSNYYYNFCIVPMQDIGWESTCMRLSLEMVILFPR